jgi:hypothetical protein
MLRSPSENKNLFFGKRKAHRTCDIEVELVCQGLPLTCLGVVAVDIVVVVGGRALTAEKVHPVIKDEHTSLSNFHRWVEVLLEPEPSLVVAENPKLRTDVVNPALKFVKRAFGRFARK